VKLQGGLPSIPTVTPNFEDYGDNAPLTEGTLVSRIEMGLDEALDSLGLDQRRSDSIKRQKYIHLAVDHFTGQNDAPLTYSWYKWGVNQVSGPSESPDPRTRYSEPAGGQKLLHTPHDAFVEFFKSEIEGLPLEDWWEEENHLAFLDQFYTEYGIPEYQEVYLANIDVLQILTDIQYSLYRGENSVSKDDYDQLCSKISSLKQAILVSDELEDSYDYLERCTDLVEDVVMILAKPDSEVIKQGHATAFSELKTFYQEHTWLIIANRISIKTARGSDRKRIIRRSESRHSDLLDTFDRELETKREICMKMNLIPTVEDYSSFEDQGEEFDETFDNLMGIIDGRMTCE
jgi:hypothetical protein